MRRYTKEQLLYFLKSLAASLNHTPTTAQMNKNKQYPSASTYRARFGSWNNALKKAHLRINIRLQYNKDILIQNLQQIAEEKARIPKTSDLNSRTGSYSTYRKYFGSWQKALKAAGISRVVDLKRFK